jgi:hypothetical protein
MIIIGKTTIELGKLESDVEKCYKCKTETKFTLVAQSSYFHIFFIPTFPLGIKGYAVCQNCKKRYSIDESSREIKNKYYGILPEPKSPIWQWSGIFLIIFLIMCIFYLKGVRSYHQYSKTDPITRKLENTLDKLTTHPDFEDDSLAYKIKHEIIPFSTMYDNEYVTVTRKNKVLIIVYYPYFGAGTEEEKIKTFKRIEDLVSKQKGIASMTKYIYVFGSRSAYYYHEVRNGIDTLTQRKDLLEGFFK